MKRICKGMLLLSLALLLNTGLAADTFAAAGDTEKLKSETITLTEETRYDSSYYKPLRSLCGEPSKGNAAAVAKAASSASVVLEQTLTEGWSEHRAVIDLTDCQIQVRDLAQQYFQVLNSHEECFWVSESCPYSYDPNTGLVVSVRPVYSMSRAEAEEASRQIRAAAAEAKALVPAGMEDYEKALIIHDWLAVYCEYDKENLDRGNVPEISHSIAGALAEKQAVCDGYAKAYQYIMKQLGIPCHMTSSSAMAHAWNILQLGGDYYHVDVTWDDPTWDCIGRARHDYFLLSDDTIQSRGRMHYGWDTELRASDKSYENTCWSNSASSLIYRDGYWYYTDSNQKKLIKTRNLLTGGGTSLYDLGSWKNGIGTWPGVFSYLQADPDRLFFNGSKAIYSMDFASGKVTEVYRPQETVGLSDNIFGFKIDGTHMYYAVQQDPNLTSHQRAYIKKAAIPGAAAPPEQEPPTTPETPTIPEEPTTPAPEEPSEPEKPVDPENPPADKPSSPAPVKVGSVIRDTKTNAFYKVTKTGSKAASRTVAYQKPVNKNKTSFVISSSVKISGTIYQVTKIADNAFKNNTKIRSVRLGANLQTIGTNAFNKCTGLKSISIPAKVRIIQKGAFANCKNLKIITIKTAKLTKKTVGANAFKGIPEKASIKVPKGKAKEYKKLLQAKGLSKKVKVK